MKTKIQITPAMREFNDSVEFADYLLDYQFDQESADVLLMRLRQAKTFPATAMELEKAMAGITATQIRPTCHCGNPQARWRGDNYNLRQFMCDKCWNEEQSKQ